MSPPTITLRVDERGPAHTRLTVFIGRNPGARGNSGQLVLRTDEWDELLAQSSRGEDGRLLLPVESIAERAAP